MFKHAKISEVWNHFTVDSEQNKTAKCNICHLKLSFKGTVSNLNKHLKNKHLITLQPTQSSQNVLSSVTASASEASSSRSEEKHDDGNVSSTPVPTEQPSTSSSFENYISALYSKKSYNNKN
jgi:hypothetical protein